MAFSPQNLEISVDSREYSHPIQTATYPPFTKGTCIHGVLPPRVSVLCVLASKDVILHFMWQLPPCTLVIQLCVHNHRGTHTLNP